MRFFDSTSVGCVLLLSASVLPSVVAVHHDEFRTCDQAGFCKRNRKYADDADATDGWKSPYSADPKSIHFGDGRLAVTVLKQVGPAEPDVRLPVQISILSSGTVRVVVDEERRLKKDIQLRHNSKARKERYNEVEKWAIVGSLEPDLNAKLGSADKTSTTIKFGPDESRLEVVVTHQPFSIDFRRDGATHVRFNADGLLNLEHWRPERKQPEGVEAPDDEATWWDEKFKKHTDSKPRGPESVALDISFPDYAHVYGIPEHAASLSLKQTRGGDGQYTDPYRLYNADVFEYELDSSMTLYGSIPFLQAHKKGSTVGVFWMNSAETWIDVVKSRPATNPLSLGTAGKTTTRTHWISESGLIDVFVFLGPRPRDVLEKYGELTGYTALPQYFSLGYHQCRWNYNSGQDVVDVSRRLEANSIPFDVIWLDIEYTDDRKYFTWDPATFPDPDGMRAQLDKNGHKLVVIIDPHIKSTDNYRVDQELRDQGLGVRNKDGNLYEGLCWPRESHWVDTFSPAAHKWWQKLYSYALFKGTGPNTFIWNDMNEPSVFEGPDTTMPKDNLHHDNWEHRDVHNLYGMTVVNATFEGLIEREPGVRSRPFVLSRSYFAGSQRLGAIWTGDNMAKWDHLQASLPMILNNGIAGYPFAGADVGGFFGNPDQELQTRWYQAGIFYPFFRAHSHIETRRREPYLLESPYLEIVAAAIRLRYQLLPVWYTAIEQSSRTGVPIVKPNFYVFPDDEAGFEIEDQMYIGSTGLLSKPVTSQSTNSVTFYLADKETYYDYFDFTAYSGSAGRYQVVSAPIDRIPLLMQAGHIIPTRRRTRASSTLTYWDPYTLTVILDSTGFATGTLYMDDGHSFEYQTGEFIHKTFIFDKSTNTLKSVDFRRPSRSSKTYVDKMSPVRIERIVVVNAPSEWSNLVKVKVSSSSAPTSSSPAVGALTFHPKKDQKPAWVEVKNPPASVAHDWTIEFAV